MAPNETPWNIAEATAFWKRWEGQVVDDKFVLGEYLGGGPDRPVFLTEYDAGRAAIKLVLADPSTAALLLSRWRTASELSHPHLARILAHGSGRLNGTSLGYVVMEHADQNLSEVLADRPLTLAETREMLEPVLNALAWIHGQGLVHGHLCPANILAVDDKLKISSDGLCPVESAEGSRSPAADIEALGMVLCEALTQRRTPGQPLSPPFLEIVDLCLQSDPLQRPTAAHLARLLLQPAAPAPEPVQKGRSRYLTWTAVAGLAILALVLPSRLFRDAPQTAPPPVATATVTPVPAPVPKNVLEKVLPDVDRRARSTIHGTVRINVRVRVNPDGRVAAANFDRAPSSGYLGKLTLQAARQWRFQPGTSTEWLLRFQLQRTETQVAAEPI